MEKTLREEIAENLHHCPKNMQKINCGRKDCDKCRIDSILSLLQQAGWGNVAEARQQAQGELSGWIRCPHCGSGAIIWGKDRILLECTNCGNKLQELPKE
jgi:hypothetical protein